MAKFNKVLYHCCIDFVTKETKPAFNGQLKSLSSSVQPFRKGRLDLDIVELEHEIAGQYENCV